MSFFDIRSDVRNNKFFLLLRIPHLEKKFLEHINGNMVDEIEFKHDVFYRMTSSKESLYLEDFKIVEKYSQDFSYYGREHLEDSNMFYVEIRIEKHAWRKDECLVSCNVMHCNERRWNDLLDDTPIWEKSFRDYEADSFKSTIEKIVEMAVESENTKKIIGLNENEGFKKVINGCPIKIEQILTYGDGFYSISFDEYLMKKDLVESKSVVTTRGLKF